VAVLVTGGAGFIGSAVSWALVDAGIEPIVLDNLSAGSPGAVAGITLHIGDVNDSRLLERIFESH
jgi:UDP-glucose 4-epimerase